MIDIPGHKIVLLKQCVLRITDLLFPNILLISDAIKPVQSGVQEVSVFVYAVIESSCLSPQVIDGDIEACLGISNMSLLVRTRIHCSASGTAVGFRITEFLAGEGSNSLFLSRMK
jgi:hypothetical protein